MVSRKNQSAQKPDLDTETGTMDNEETTSTATSEVSDAVHRGVEKWIDAHLRNTAFSRDTKAWNVLQSALPLLAPAILEETN